MCTRIPVTCLAIGAAGSHSVCLICPEGESIYVVNRYITKILRLALLGCSATLQCHTVSHTHTQHAHTRARAPVYARECWHLWKRTVLHPFDTCEKSFFPFSPFFLSPAFSRAAHLLPSLALLSRRLSLVVAAQRTTTVTIVVPTTACTIQRNAIVRGLFLVLARFELILRLLVIFFSRSPLSFTRYPGDVWHFPFAVSHPVGGLVLGLGNYHSIVPVTGVARFRPLASVRHADWLSPVPN